MLETLDTLGRASGEWLWTPILAWTVLWAVSEAAHRFGASVHPLVRYRATQAALFALPLGLALSPLLDPAALAPWLNPPIVIDVAPMAMEAVAPEAAVAAPLAPEAWAFSGWAVLGLVVFGLGGLALVRLGQLGRQVLTLHRLRRSLPVSDPTLAPEARTLARRLGLRRRVRAIATPEAPVPMTFGLWRPVVVIPAGLVGEARTLALLHELVHVQRRDTLAGWAGALTSALFSFHPGVGRLARRCHLLREMACDAALLGEPSVDRSAYATLISAFAAPSARLRAAVGMADSPSHVRQRITAMTRPLPLLRQSTLALGWVLSAALLLGASLAVTTSRALAQETRVIVRTAKAESPVVVVVDGERQSSGADGIADLDVHSVNVVAGEEAQERFGENQVIEVITRAEADARGLPEREGGIDVFALRTADLDERARVLLRTSSPETVSIDSLRGILGRFLDGKGGGTFAFGDGPDLNELRQRLGRLPDTPIRLRVDSLPTFALRLNMESTPSEGRSPNDMLALLPRLMDTESSARRSSFFSMDLSGTDSLHARDIARVSVERDGSDRRLTFTMRDGTTRVVRSPRPTGSTAKTLTSPDTDRADARPLAPVQIRPNPASRSATVQFEMLDAGTARFRLYDLTGRLVFERDVSSGAGPQSLRVDVSDLAPGGYVYRLETEGQEAQTGRFTVAR